MIDPNVNVTQISNADLGSLLRDANAGVSAALATGHDDLYAAACAVAKIYRLEILRRTEQAIGDQPALAVIEVERA